MNLRQPLGARWSESWPVGVIWQEQLGSFCSQPARESLRHPARVMATIAGRPGIVDIPLFQRRVKVLAGMSPSECRGDKLVKDS